MGWSEGLPQLETYMASVTENLSFLCKAPHGVSTETEAQKGEATGSSHPARVGHMGKNKHLPPNLVLFNRLSMLVSPFPAHLTLLPPFSIGQLFNGKDPGVETSS